MGDSGVRHSEGQGQLAGALSLAQGSYGAIPQSREVEVKTKDGRSYRFKYAPLDVILDAVRPALAANGLAVTQEISGSDVKWCTTTLLHKSGEWRSSELELPGQAETAQQFGSQVTYARRYALQCVLGVAAESDDDGNAADGNQAKFVDKPKAESRDRQPPKAAPPAVGSVHPLEAKLVAAGFPKQRMARWALDMVGTGNFSVLTGPQLAILGELADAWVAGGDDAHAKKFEEMKDQIAAAKKKAG